jgi:hypothetical protein
LSSPSLSMSELCLDALSLLSSVCTRRAVGCRGRRGPGNKQIRTRLSQSGARCLVLAAAL